MSGTIKDLPLRICRCCRNPWIEDDRMYFDPNQCPNCGAYPYDCDPSGGPIGLPDEIAPII